VWPDPGEDALSAAATGSGAGNDAAITQYPRATIVKNQPQRASGPNAPICKTFAPRERVPSEERRVRGRRRNLLAGGICCVLLFLFFAPPVARAFEGPTGSGRWTQTDPPINLVHIDFGEINRRGEAVGYHHRVGGVDPAGARVLQIVQPPDRHGVYRARVAIRDPTTGAWVKKHAPSTFYPDTMSDREVVGLILAAFHQGERRGDGQFIGSSGRGFVIEGWYQNGRINAAYPLRGP
jgi:hypothetical protein